MTKKSFIESDFPVKKISEYSSREKSARQGHISTLHSWWARRPLASSRASIFAALIPEPEDEYRRLEETQFISNLSKWENSFDRALISRARKEILAANGGKPPEVLDPFAGGGSIPLEALRLGCQTYASDLNPVAVLILKATLEYPQKYGSRTRGANDLLGESEERSLSEDVNRWGSWVLKEMRKEIGRFYPSEPDGSIPVAYIWLRTVKCQNPACGADIPLVRRTWLKRRGKGKTAYAIIPKDNKIDLAVENVGPDWKCSGKNCLCKYCRGTVTKGKVICPCCGSGLSHKEVMKQFREGKASQRMAIVVLRHINKKGKMYRLASESDLNTYREAEKVLDKKRKELCARWGFDPVPDEPTPEGKGSGAERAFSVRNYGLKTWGDLFNSRQKLALITSVEKTREAYQNMLQEKYNEQYAVAVTTYLAIINDKLAEKTSSLCRWLSTSGQVVATFSRMALPMVWDYAEFNPLMNEFTKLVSEAIAHFSQVSDGLDIPPAQTTQSSAATLAYNNSFFDAVMTDPPYYDNAPYSYLSDFFYVWLKRTIADLYPDLFATPLTPKAEEIVVYANREGGYEGGKRFFEKMISRAFEEICRVLKPEGIACVVFAHQSTEAWETIISALSNSGLYLTASWPVHTEMKGRLRASESAALASSIYMVCRKRTEKKSTYYNEIKPQIQEKVMQKLNQFWTEGIGGSDFFISAIGPAMEVFGKYHAVEKLSGEVVSPRELLDFVRKSVGEYALTKILKSPQLSGIDTATRFYLLWRWTYGSAKVHFDDARKLSQAVGLEITEEWGNGFVRKDKEFISVSDATGRGRKFLDRKQFETMIDVIHACLLHWERDEKKAITTMLEETGNLNNNAFWEVAQSISDVLPEGDKERKMLQGFLYGKEGYGKAKSKVGGYQKTLFEEDKK